MFPHPPNAFYCSRKQDQGQLTPTQIVSKLYLEHLPQFQCILGLSLRSMFFKNFEFFLTDQGDSIRSKF